MSQTCLSDSGWIASPRDAPMSGPGSALMRRIKYRPAAPLCRCPQGRGDGLSFGESHIQRVEDRFKHISNDRFGAGLNVRLKNHSWRNWIVGGAGANMVL